MHLLLVQRESVFSEVRENGVLLNTQKSDNTIAAAVLCQKREAMKPSIKISSG